MPIIDIFYGPLSVSISAGVLTVYAFMKSCLIEYNNQGET